MSLKELAPENSCVYIQTEDLFFNREEELLTDGLHPNATGHQLIFERLKSSLEKEGII